MSTVVNLELILTCCALFREEIAELVPNEHLDGPKSYCKKKDCNDNHSQICFSEKPKNIKCWRDVSKYLLRLDTLKQVITCLSKKQTLMGPLSAVFWDQGTIKFTIKDLQLIKAIIDEILKIKYSVENANKVLKNVRPPTGTLFN